MGHCHGSAVSSAPARVDPHGRHVGADRPGFFRARAGGPRDQAEPGKGRQFLPRPRGWTRSPRCPRGNRSVSSAPARVDPAKHSSARQCACFFRARAGGPGCGSVSPVVSPFLPRPRGWTFWEDPMTMIRRVSSAPARVDPVRVPVHVHRSRFFRARAGGPHPQAPVEGGQRFLPRPRGWTDDLWERQHDHAVSSAPARVDRDGDPPPGAERGFFRARAGGPLWRLRRFSSTQFLPRPRGWTSIRQLRRRKGTVSSAPARVDRCRRSRRRSLARFFRARAGGPIYGSDAVGASKFLPRLRGWTWGLSGVLGR